MNSYREFAYIYDELMDDVDYIRWVDYYEQIFRQMGLAPNTLADLACGTGNLTIPLAKRGYNVVGVDISEDMLWIASEKARQNGVRVPFICQDVREFQLHHEAEAIVCGCDGINYLLTLGDVERCFSSVYKHLKDQGVFIFDISSRYKLEQIIGNQFFGEDRESVAYLWQNQYDKKERLCTMDITFFVQEGKYFRKFREIHTQKAHEIDEMVMVLEQVGFSIAGIYNDFALTEPREKSERIQFVCQKKNES